MAVIYQIYPISFFDSNNDGFGDLEGIIEKLHYVKDLGCDGIWINPIYQSPFEDGGYDVTNFYKINPKFGTVATLKKLIKKAHELDLKIYLDLVPGHLSNCSKEFINALHHKKQNLFIFANRKAKPNDKFNLINIKDEKNFSFLANFFSFQPALNYGFYNIDEEWQKFYKDKSISFTKRYIINVMKHYLKLGVDGFRVDMAGSLVKNDSEYEGTIEVWKSMFSVIKEQFPNSYFVSEWNNPSKAGRAGFDADFDLFGPGIFEETFKNGKIGFKKIRKMFLELSERLNNAKLNNISLATITGNHDQKRIASLIGTKLSKTYLLLASFLPGDFYVYYGDEIGLKTYDVEPKDGGRERTGSRTPFQWNNSKNRGFSDSDFIYLPTSNDDISLENEINDSNSIYSLLKKLIHIKKEVDSINNEFHLSVSKDKISIHRGNYCFVLNISKSNLRVKNCLVTSGNSNNILCSLEACIEKNN